ncbi:heat shock protein Hsp20 [Propionicimonas paludicola]|uniref:Heat shock protein Hsp20 n=1 Tax=Propionicimonas paludicola TaxID=185243 RepID=A0A2A9CPZ8_9ACTN|nr:Hsp20/alpha crystallin family protein [Propionicimonas paludicola]PFG16165.1 heat shock protein Hsp20 [Propionicimonas paludicola]
MARAYDPFREMERWFADAARTPTSAAMPMDLYRDGDVFVTRIDLPGVDPASIDVDVDDRTLTVRAERKVETTDSQKWLVRERPAGTFARQLTLGYGVALDKIEAQYADGVLSLRIPVAEEAKPRKISVAHAGGATEIEGSLAS